MQSWEPRPIGNRFLPYGTPLHVRDLILTLLRYQFEHFPEDYPYKYIPDDYEATHIIFDVAYNKDSEVYGKKPIVIVERGPQNTSPIVVGDMSAKVFRTGHQKDTTLVQSSVSTKVLSRIRMETEIIAQTIFGLFTAYRVWLPGIIGIHDIPAVSLSDIANFEQDAQMYACQVDMQYSMQYRWIADVRAPMLEGIKVYNDLSITVDEDTTN